MDQSSIDRINALYHKSQAVGLTSQGVYSVYQKQHESAFK